MVSLKTRSIAITGHRGFIGSHLKSALELVAAQIVPIEGDVRDPANWNQEFDVLFHLASPLPGIFVSDPAEGFSVSVEGTLRALDACRRWDATMVFASTCGVYKPSAGVILSEECPLAPVSLYARGKLMVENLCEVYADEFGTPSSVLRLFNVYGIRQKPEFIIPYLVDCTRREETANIRNPDSRRDFVYVEDVVEAFMMASIRAKEGFDVFNIGTGTAHSVRDVISLLGEISGQSVNWKNVCKNNDVQPDIRAGIHKASEELGWRPSFDLEDGLRHVLELKYTNGVNL